MVNYFYYNQCYGPYDAATKINNTAYCECGLLSYILIKSHYFVFILSLIFIKQTNGFFVCF